LLSIPQQVNTYTPDEERERERERPQNQWPQLARQARAKSPKQMGQTSSSGGFSVALMMLSLVVPAAIVEALVPSCLLLSRNEARSGLCFGEVMKMAQ